MTDMGEIEMAIEPCRHLLASFHPGEMTKSLAVGVLGISSAVPFRSRITSNTSTRQFSLFERVSTYLMQKLLGFLDFSLRFYISASTYAAVKTTSMKSCNYIKW